MIPKIIHYCWFGGKPLPESAQKCIASWREFLPDYEIKEWNESNFDVNAIPYTAEAYAMKKYAFVSDYARFKILYEQGGLYFDTDVEVIKPLDDIIERGAFMGLENNGQKGAAAPAAAPGLGLGVNPGLGLGVNPGLGLLKKLLDSYSDRHFEYHEDIRLMKTIVHYTTELLIEAGMVASDAPQYVAEVWIYPKEYFCPINVTTGRMKITDNTRTIHHYAGTWHEHGRKSWKEYLRQVLPESFLIWYSYKFGRLRKG